jgi:hypothetical protein
VRLAVAGQRVLDDDTARSALAGGDESWDDRTRVAVKMAMALMTRPGDLDDVTVAAARELFSVDELVELTLDVMKWNAQKPPVALGVDVEVRPGELVDLVFDADGNWVRPGS